MIAVVVGVGERGGGDLEDEDGEGSEGRRRVFGEEGGGEGGGGGFEEMGESLEYCHLVDEFVDVGDV